MLLNDIKSDIGKLIESRGASASEIGERVFGNKGAVYMLYKRHTISEGYERLCEILGYDIEFNYEDRVPEGRYVLNDVREDIKHLCWWRGTNLLRISKECGTSPSNYYQMLTKNIVTERFYRFCRELGYGIRLRYIPRGEK